MQGYKYVDPQGQILDSKSDPFNSYKFNFVLHLCSSEAAHLKTVSLKLQSNLKRPLCCVHWCIAPSGKVDFTHNFHLRCGAGVNIKGQGSLGCNIHLAQASAWVCFGAFGSVLWLLAA